MRALDWSETALGPVENWPQSLRTSVNILLESKFPMYIAWGSDYIQFYNDGYRPILGSSKHPQALGRGARDTFPESWHIIGPMFTDVRRGIASGSEDWMLPLDRNGYLEECYFTFSYSPIRDETGGVGGVLTTVSETTARVLGERRLATLQALAALASNAKNESEAWTGAIEICGRNESYIAFCLLFRMTGSGAFELAGSCGLSGEGAELALRPECWPLADLLRERRPSIVENVRELFGEVTGPQWPEPVRSALLLPIDKPGLEHPYGVLVVGISPRRALDDHYRGFLALVADQIATGIANIRAYEEERRRVELLAELDRAKTQFFSNVSHEFRTPLTLMLGPLEDMLAAREGIASDEMMERLRLIHRNGLRLLRLVNSLLDFSRIEAGRIQARFQATDLCSLTEDLASSFRPLMERAGLSFLVTCKPLPEVVWVDQEMWEKILLNLLSNAFKFTLSGEVKVNLEAEGEQVVLRVSDTGAGIPAQELPHVFERFHRVQGARGRSFEGSGIGLALVQELVRLHGGTIGVESAPGHGTTFTVALPFGNRHLPTAKSNISAPPVTVAGAHAFVEEALQWLPGNGKPAEISLVRANLDSSLPHGLAGARVLIADDNADMRNYVCRLLRHAGYEAETALGGEEAIASALANRPDLVLCDVMMPDLDGFAVLKALRSDPISQAIPVILLSARAGEEAKAEGLDAGADDYLTKPFSARELLARVGAHIKLARVRRHAEEQAQVILESITDGFFALDPDWRFTYINSEGERLIGFRRDQMMGKVVWEAYPEAVGTIFQEQYVRAMEQRVPVDFEAYYGPLNVWLRVRAYPADTGGISVFYEDITERKLAERALRESEERYRSLFEQITDGIFVTDYDGRYADVNPAGCQMFGYTRDEMLNLTISDVIEPRERQRLPTQFALLATEDIVRNDWQFVRKDRSSFTGELVARRLPDGRYQGVVRDITLRKRYEDALRESEERFRTLADNMSQLAWMADAEGSITWFNKRWYNYTGTTAEETRRGGWQHVIHPEHLKRVMKRLRHSFESGAVWEDTFPLRRSEGHYRWFLSRALPIRDANGRVARWFGTSTDIDEQLQTEQELRRANQDLEQFAYSASHDLQEPLRTVVVYSQLLGKRYSDQLDEEAYSLLTQIVGGAKRMSELLADLLAYTRIGSPGEEAVAPTSANPVLREVLNDLSQMLTESAGAISSDNLPTLLVRPSHLRQLLQNLLSNALKYRNDGEPPRIHVSAVRESSMWRMSVTDNGIGIAPKYHEQVFGIFKRLHSNNAKYDGTGIGLAICQKIVDRYGGRIWLDSQEGHGSTFHFTLPGLPHPR